ncbi:response regulator [Paenibacillus sp. UMB7766-LJ446]|uniref:response regulator n=1 Tax=Paenibacillus sp. UMB7766-LJ446 TaxID=3046313 RepID=UPI002551A8DB|nr:response regulator [Paenibacillus sp. UMB7766-LJ446]MDK8192418.1 response regulator [Paenibacillus sp. UMB7766-LJ446]
MNLTALLVDDELPILENLSFILPWEDMGIEIVGTARSGSEALDKVAEYHPDIMLCDIRMPSMDGLELIRMLREQGETCEIILLTGYQQFEYARTAIRYNVHEYICKPIDYLDLEHKLRELAGQIQKKRLEMEAERHRKLEMEVWVRHKHIIDLMRKEEDTLFSSPPSSPEPQASSLRYVLLLIDVSGYFKHSIGWSGARHQSWHGMIRSRLREVTDGICEGTLLISARKGEWCILVEASDEWELRAAALAQQVLLELDATFEPGSGMKTRVIQDVMPVRLDDQMAERYRHCQRLLIMNDSDQRSDVLESETGEPSIMSSKEPSRRATLWITKEDLDLITRWIRQGNKQGLIDLLVTLKHRISEHKSTLDGVAENSLRFLLVHMLRELREVHVMAEQDEIHFWSALHSATSIKELIELAEALAFACHDKKSTPRPSVSELIMSACEYMNARLECDLGIDEVADWLGISPGYFCQLFKNQMGVTFVEYMTHKRMESAALLLSTTEWSITAIGEATGYKERRYFSKVFHKHFHMKPSEFRSNLRAGS